MFRKRHPEPGAAPGSMVIPPGALPTRLRVMDYDAARLDELEVSTVRELARFRSSRSVTWIDVQGLGNPSMLEELAAMFSIHRLALADVANVPQRPKVEPYDDNVLIITRMIRMNHPPTLNVEQLSILLGPGHVITFQEEYGDVLDSVRSHLRMGGTIRHSGADYLAYSILDAVVDGYYPVLETIGDYFETVEDEVVTRPSTDALCRIHFLRRELLKLRRSIWPQRDAINSLIRDELPLISNSVQVFIRDCHDHAVQIAEVVESYRELTASLMEVYLSSVSNRLNEIMKLLTVIATVFIPLTFIVGVYGMNFDYMPELHYRWAYPIVWLIVLVIGSGLIFKFWRWGWLSDGSRIGSPRFESRPRR